MTFYLGFSISAYQTEGNNIYSDWYHFEGEKLPKSSDACRLWEKYEDLIPILKDLNANAFRFSIEWSRIFPTKDKINYSNFRRYVRFINLLIENNIEPFVTLWHFTNPKWFFDLGGWENKENIDYFIEYSDFVITNLRKIGVKYFITFNEPLVYVFSAYILGVFPPFRKISDIKDLSKALEILENMKKASEEVYKIIKEKEAKGIYVENFSGFNIPFQLKLLLRENLIKFVLSTIPKTDGIGINYYGISINGPNRIFKPSISLFKKILELTSKKTNEIFITENGINTEDELERVKFIKKHLSFVVKNKDRYKIKGYFVWSLMDNYEWDIGYKAKFGIMTRDLEPKDSYYEIKNLFSILKSKKF